MSRITILLVLMGLACDVHAQLNYEGNPLTENTEYMALESQFSQRASRHEVANNVPNRHIPQKLYPVYDTTTPSSVNGTQAIDAKIQNVRQTAGTAELQANQINRTPPAETTRQLQAYPNRIQPINPAEVALSTFLNSRTPEESRISLDTYIRSAQPQTTVQPRIPQTSAVHQRNPQEMGQVVRVDTNRMIQKQMLPVLGQQQTIQALPHPQIDQRQLLHVNQPINQQQVVQSVPVVNERQQLAQTNLPGYAYVGQQQLANPQDLQGLSTVPRTPLMAPGQQVVQQVPYVPLSSVGIHARNDVVAPPGWPYRRRRIRGNPNPYAQPRLGPNYYKGPPPQVPYKQKGPVEVIYTRPPGFHRGPPPISNPPLRYEDASAFFPDADYPPPSKDIYYSQLYAQSYDPHYYNYIAKTGKIKPHLYGKLGKPHEEPDDIWAELYSGFKKHGLKNIMTPTFLLGMTIPAITLMLTALIQKRSISRSDSRDLHQDDGIQEYVERLQRAMECYDKAKRKTRDATKADECWNVS